MFQEDAAGFGEDKRIQEGVKCRENKPFHCEQSKRENPGDRKKWRRCVSQQPVGNAAGLLLFGNIQADLASW